jgi:hypothetical protein
MTMDLVGRDLFYYLSIIDTCGTPDEAASLFLGCYRKLERGGGDGPGDANIRNLFRRFAAGVPALHADAVRRGMVRQVAE